jgi:CubicO group peptidase (beta-lactamase class C family)
MAAPHPSGKIEEIPMRSLILGAALLFCASAIAQPLPGAVVAIARDGKLVLSPKSVALMTSDHLGLNIKNQVAAIEGHRDGYGFGLGVAVRLYDGLAAVPGTPGDFTWNGAYGTAFWADPQERLVVVYGTAAPGDIRKYYREQVDALVYGAMTELRKPK